jgi:NADH-ubiquinone oxidoreductase chain 5
MDKHSLGSGSITFFTNRLGDVLLMLVICIMRAQARWGLIDLEYFKDYSVLMGFLFLGGLTKSAQLPFRAWLPAAIAAPTPISSLVHSSTLVTAGCFLLIRFAGSLVSEFYTILSLVCAMGGILAGCRSVFE